MHRSVYSKYVERNKKTALMKVLLAAGTAATASSILTLLKEKSRRKCLIRSFLKARSNSLNIGKEVPSYSIALFNNFTTMSNRDISIVIHPNPRHILCDSKVFSIKIRP